MMWIIYFLIVIITFIITISIDLYIDCENYTRFDLFMEIVFSITPVINLVILISYLIYSKRNHIPLKEALTLFFENLSNK